MNSYKFLKSHLIAEYKLYFGMQNREKIEMTVRAWLNDKTNSKGRFDELENFAPGNRKLLDMSSGCGSAVFYGLLNGYDMYGVDPENWKHQFNIMKAREYDYPSDWTQRFCSAVGEYLPYADNSFDCVTTYQTLEHVQDLTKVISEMLRVTRSGGVIHIRCPDYMSTFEGHYMLPWFPLFPRPLAKIYLRLLNRPTRGLNTLQYTTQNRLVNLLNKTATNHSIDIKIVDINRIVFEKILTRRSWPDLPGLYWLWSIYLQVRRLFRRENSINLIVFLTK